MLFRDSFLNGVFLMTSEQPGAFIKFLPLFELALVLVRFYHVASFIINADHSVM